MPSAIAATCAGRIRFRFMTRAMVRPLIDLTSSEKGSHDRLEFVQSVDCRSLSNCAVRSPAAYRRSVAFSHAFYLPLLLVVRARFLQVPYAVSFLLGSVRGEHGTGCDRHRSLLPANPQ
jgi:hypothetical protein